MPTLTLKKEEAQEIVWGDHETAEVVNDAIVDKSRWSVIHKVIFKLNGKFYRGRYSKGATEYQDEMPYENVDTVTFTEVEPFQTTITDYRDVV